MSIGSIEYGLIFVLSFLMTFLITPTIRYTALKFSVIEKKDPRKIHTRVITKLGGISIFIGVHAGMILAYMVLHKELSPFFLKMGLISICGIIGLSLGLYDDVRGANAVVKFSVQIFIALLLINAGYRLPKIRTPFLTVDWGHFKIIATILWVVGLTNAINLLDGLDGLACGISAIAAFAFGIFAISFSGNIMAAVISFSLCGACLGFLKYNFFPAKIFMGDTGSLFIGVMLSILSLEVTRNKIPFLSTNLLYPIIILFIPIVDTLQVFIRRLWRGAHPFSADKRHIHHRLLRSGLRHKHVVLIMYLCAALCTLAAILLFEKWHL